MNKSLLILAVSLLSLSAAGLFTSTGVDGAMIEEQYTDALLPDVYTMRVNNNVSAYIWSGTNLPTTYLVYAENQETAVNNALIHHTGVLPTSSYAGSGPGLLYVFTYVSPSRLYSTDPWIDLHQLNLVAHGISFSFSSGMLVKIERMGTYSGTMYFGRETGSDYKYLYLGANEFIVPASGTWRIYPYDYYSPDLSSQIFMTFSIEYEDAPADVALYGYAMLAAGAACIGLVVISAGKQRIKD